MASNLQYDLKADIARHLTQMINEQQEEVIKDAVTTFETRVRAKVAGTVLRIFDAYSVERMGNQILIRVDIRQ